MNQTTVDDEKLHRGDSSSSPRKPAPGRLRVVSAADLLAREFPPREYLFENERVPLGSLGLVVGPPRAGKGMSLIAAAVSVAAGIELAVGFRPIQARPVVVVAAEDTERRIRDRIHALRRGYRIAPEHLRRLHLIIRPHPPLCLERQGEIDKLLAVIQPLEPGLVVVDGLRRVTLAEENDSTAMAGPLSALERLRDVTDAAVLVVHHTTISGREGVYRARGSSAIAAHFDYQVAVDRPGAGDTILLRAGDDRDGDGWSAALRLERGKDGSAKYVGVDVAAHPSQAQARGRENYGKVVKVLYGEHTPRPALWIATKAGVPRSTATSILDRMATDGSAGVSEGKRGKLYLAVKVRLKSTQGDDDEHTPRKSSSSSANPTSSPKKKCKMRKTDHARSVEEAKR